MARVSHDADLLQAALYGYQMEKEKIEAKIRDLQAELKGKKAPSVAVKSAKPARRREMSDAARARIAAAQRKRWAEFHKKKAAAQGGD
jgi:cell division septum initiation protein DivIVA